MTCWKARSRPLFEAFEPLAREREVIWYDQLGVGRSDSIEDTSLLTVGRFLDELGAVTESLGLERPHVYGHSWGAMLGLQFAAERDPQWKDWNIFDELHRIRVPTLVLGGEFDECVPSHLTDIARRIPGSEHITQPGAAHMGYLEEESIRREYVSIIGDYMARIEARP